MADHLLESLSLYGLRGGKATLLRHNENRTYRIDCDGQAYCLRLKDPVSGFDLSVFGGDPESLLRGELALLNALGEGADIPVQAPVPTLTGDPVARLSDGTLASLLSWMDGTPLNAGACTQPMLLSAGQTLARLRSAAETDPALRSHCRLSYDQALTRRLAQRAEQGAGTLPAQAIRSILDALQAISRVMDDLDGSEEALIAHADPGFGNLIWTNGGVGLIDWSLSGYAHSYTDLGGLMGATGDREAQRLILQGWESVRGKADRRCVDACFALNVLLFVCCQYTRAGEWADWFPAALGRWQETVFDPLSSGRAIPCIL